MNKENRKVVCADCLLISYKFNQLCEVATAESSGFLEATKHRERRVRHDSRRAGCAVWRGSG